MEYAMKLQFKITNILNIIITTKNKEKKKANFVVNIDQKIFPCLTPNFVKSNKISTNIWYIKILKNRKEIHL